MTGLLLPPRTQRRPGLVVIIAFVVTLAGRFTLDRVGVQLPLVLNDVRVPLFAILLMSFALELSRSGHRLGPGGTRSLLAVWALLGYQILSATWAPDGAAIGAGVIDLTAVGVLVAVYVLLAEWDRDRVALLTFGCFQVTAWLYFVVAAAGLGRGSNGRWAVPGGGPNVFVRIMVIGVFTAVYFFLRTRRKLWLLGLPAFLIGALASGSRGGLAAMLIALGLGLPAALRRLRARGGRIGKPVGAGVLVLGVTWLVAGDWIGGFVQKRFVSETFQQGYTSGRSELFTFALHLFLERPYFGTGVNGFSVVANLGYYERYVHNLPLAVAAEGGAVGLFLLVNAWLQLRHEFARMPSGRRTLETRTAGYCGVFVGAASLFSGEYYDARLMWILLVLAAVHPGAIKGGPLVVSPPGRHPAGYGDRGPSGRSGPVRPDAN